MTLLEFTEKFSGIELQPWQREMLALVEKAHARGEPLQIVRRPGKSWAHKAIQHYRARLSAS